MPPGAGIAVLGRTAGATEVVRGLKGERAVKVLGENRRIESKDGVFKDKFKAWDVHIYVLEK